MHSDYPDRVFPAQTLHDMRDLLARGARPEEVSRFFRCSLRQVLQLRTQWGLDSVPLVNFGDALKGSDLLRRQGKDEEGEEWKRG